MARDVANPPSHHGSGPSEADRLKDEFFTLVTHELRTPLTSIVGYAELLREKEDLSEEQQSKYVDVIWRNGKRMLRLVGDMLFIAKAEAGNIDLDPREFDVAEVVRECIERFAPRAKRDGLDLRAEVEETGTIVGDPGRVGQAVDNLISNAIKFTPPGGTVTVRARPAASGAVALEVSDTGPGIPDTDRDRLFERFYRTEDAREQAIEGTGLGLSIVKAIVDGHGGAIDVRSEAGAGTTFAIELPPAAAAPAGI